MKKYLFVSIILVVLLVGCATKEQGKTEEQITEKPEETIPQQQETQPSAEVQEPEEIKTIPDDIKEVLELGKTKLKSYSYNYKSPGITEAYKLYVKGNKIKIVPPEIVNVEEGKFYNTIYIDTEKKTAEAYCIGYSDCTINLGKIKDLNYAESYIKTSLDWLEEVTEAQKIDERQVEGRNALYLDTNIGKITVESLYGFLYRIEDGDKIWEFSDAAFNSVSDSDVTPP